MTIDPIYCSSSFLMYRFIVDSQRCFSSKYKKTQLYRGFERRPIRKSYELQERLREIVEDNCSKQKTALALSGGIDSAILAKFMPKGSVAYTFKCIVPGINVTDETAFAARYAEECGLEHRVIEIYWQDFERNIDTIMIRKNQPTHSIEVQIYKAAQIAKSDGFDAMIFGETADCVYGGHSNLLSRDWTIGEFVDRWSFVKPYQVLKEFEFVMDPYLKYEHNGYINVPDFLTDFEYYASVNFYINATEMAGINLIVPYAHTRMADPLDLELVRGGITNTWYEKSSIVCILNLRYQRKHLCRGL